MKGLLKKTDTMIHSDVMAVKIEDKNLSYMHSGLRLTIVEVEDVYFIFFTISAGMKTQKYYLFVFDCLHKGFVLVNTLSSAPVTQSFSLLKNKSYNLATSLEDRETLISYENYSAKW